MSIGSASCFEKNREAQTGTIARSATSFSATVVILGASFMPMLAYPKMPLVFGVSNFTSGKDARARSKTTLRTESRQYVGEPIGRANLVAKSPAVANGRAAHASVLVFICGADSYSATCGATCGGSGLLFGNLVGVAGFEPDTQRRKHATAAINYS